MKISYELEQGYIDVWNEKSEEWDRYIKINKKSNIEEKKIEKLRYCDVETIDEDIRFCIKNINMLVDKSNEIIDEINKLKEDR